MLKLLAILVGLSGSLEAVAQPEGNGGRSNIGAPVLLLADGVSTPCACASTTVPDTMKIFTLPAGQLANVGDMIHVIAGGTLAANTNTKAARPKIGGVLLSVPTGATAAQIYWDVDIWLLKTGPNVQTWWEHAGVTNAYNGNGSGTLTLTDTAPIAIAIDALNSTAVGAGSVTTQMLVVQYWPGS